MKLAWVVLAVAACGGDDASEPVSPEVTDPLAYVDPTIGAGGIGFSYGSCFVGAASPHGLVKAGPDTDGPFGTIEFQHFSGYHADDTAIRGFSQLHLHGAGATDYGVLSVMPVTAYDPSKHSVVDYETPFAKADEHAAPGRYQVKLANGIGVDVAATQRAALYRFTNAGAIVIDLAKALGDGTIDDAAIDIDDAAGTASGHLHHVGGMSGGYGGYTLYFAMKGAWSAHDAWDRGAALTVSADATLAIGLSFVSVDGARANLAAEVPAIDVEAVASTARAAWSKKLGTVLLTGGTDAQRRIFYTSLYHAFLMPSVIGDVDGTYRLIGQPAKVASGYAQLSDLSLWDTYRTVSPLYAWLAPDSARDAARSLVGFGEGLGAYPKWPLAIGETGTMLGASAEIAIADAVVRGVPDAGGDLAYAALFAAATDPSAPAGSRGGRDRVVEYMQDGFVPASDDRSVSMTTEYASDDAALANLAAALGHGDDAAMLRARSQSWRSLFDARVGFLRAAAADGTFAPVSNFDPTKQTSDFAEANAWQSLWMNAIYDRDGYIAAFGGADGVVQKLSLMFDLTKADWETGDPSENSFPRPYYWHGNEPDLSAAFAFAKLGRPDLTATWARWIQDNLYSDQPDGVAGNDDGGALGSWYVLSTLGVYPIAGTDAWILASPRFPKARVLVGGHELSITAVGSGPFVQGVTLDGAPVDAPVLTHAQLAGASALAFTMGDSPSGWGTSGVPD